MIILNFLKNDNFLCEFLCCESLAHVYNSVSNLLLAELERKNCSSTKPKTNNRVEFSHDFVASERHIFY